MRSYSSMLCSCSSGTEGHKHRGSLGILYQTGGQSLPAKGLAWCHPGTRAHSPRGCMNQSLVTTNDTEAFNAFPAPNEAQLSELSSCFLTLPATPVSCIYSLKVIFLFFSLHDEIYKINVVAQEKYFGTKGSQDLIKDFLQQGETLATWYHYFPLETEMEKESEGNSWGENEAKTTETTSPAHHHQCQHCTFQSRD